MMKLTMFLRLTLLLTASAAAAASPLPQLGAPAPPALLKAHAHPRLCAAGEGHRDPCADLRIHGDRITVGWNASTRQVTYLYSTTLITDDDLAAGDLDRIDPTLPLVPFLTGFISSEWCDTDADLSGDARWCAVMKPADRHYGQVLGFVQSVYVVVPPSPDDLPVFMKASSLRFRHPKVRSMRSTR